MGSYNMIIYISVYVLVAQWPITDASISLPGSGLLQKGKELLANSNLLSSNSFFKNIHLLKGYLGNMEEFNLLKNISEKDAQDYKNQLDLGSSNEDVNLNITQLITKYGYEVEQHETRTDDGYILTMFRIPQEGKPVVFLMHGLFCSADEWITPGPENGLAYLLAKDGYDVWMGNARGNKHSRRHESLSPEKEQEKFWDFCWDEIGRLDLPAMIDYVLKITQAPKLKYVGHSQGTTSFFVMASERPEYNDKISLMVALSPIAWMSHMMSPFIRLIAPLSPVVSKLLELIGSHEFLPSNKLSKLGVRLICKHETLSGLLCGNVVFMFCGFNHKQLNMSILPVMFSHVPAGSSTRQVLHYGQEVESGKFQKYDFGAKKNMEKYNSSVPPTYKVEKITAPVALFYSEKDWLSNEKDVNILKESLSNVVDFYKVPDKQFNHMDYMWAKDFKCLIYTRILELFAKY